MSYETKGFDGYVYLKNSIWPPGQIRNYEVFHGKVSVLEGKEMLGFDVKDESNWIARVESPDGRRSMNFPGCQVRAVLQGEFGTANDPREWVYEV